jgi:hypothetical protein
MQIGFDIIYFARLNFDIFIYFVLLNKLLRIRDRIIICWYASSNLLRDVAKLPILQTFSWFSFFMETFNIRVIWFHIRVVLWILSMSYHLLVNFIKFFSAALLLANFMSFILSTNNSLNLEFNRSIYILSSLTNCQLVPHVNA